MYDMYVLKFANVYCERIFIVIIVLYGVLSEGGGLL